MHSESIPGSGSDQNKQTFHPSEVGEFITDLYRSNGGEETKLALFETFV